ncbi:ERYTHROCYTE MEMBRANE PROTEIN PFEMP3, partial [Plasmodium yoelii yoelii]
QFYDNLTKKNKKKKNKNANDKGANFIKHLKEETKNNSTNKHLSNSDIGDSLAHNNEDTYEKNPNNNLLLSNFKFIDITDIKKQIPSFPISQNPITIESENGAKTNALTTKLASLNNVGENKNYEKNNKSSNDPKCTNSEQHDKETKNFYIIDLSILKEEELNEYKKKYNNTKLDLKEILKSKLENVELKKLLHHFNFTHVNGNLINNYISKKNKQHIIICETYKHSDQQYFDLDDSDTTPVNPLYVQENINYIKNCEKSAQEIKKLENLLTIEISKHGKNENLGISNNGNGNKGINNEVTKKGKKNGKNEQNDDKNNKKKIKNYSVFHQKEGQKNTDKISSILEEKFENILNNKNYDENFIYNFYQGLQLLNDQLCNKSTEQNIINENNNASHSLTDKNNNASHSLTDKNNNASHSLTDKNNNASHSLINKNMIITTANTINDIVKKYNINNINGIKTILIKNGYDIHKYYTGIDLIFLFLSKIKGGNLNFMNEHNYTNNQNIYEIILNQIKDINYEKIKREYQCLDYILQTFEYIDETYLYTKYKNLFDFTDYIFTLQNLTIDQNTDITHDIFNLFFDILNNLFCYGIGIVNNFSENNKEIIKVSKLEAFFDQVHKSTGSLLIIDNSFYPNNELYTFIQYNSYFWYILYKQYDMFLSYYDHKNHCQIFNAFLFHFLNYVFNFPMDNFFKIDNKLSNQNDLLVKGIFKKCLFLENDRDIYLFKIIFSFLLQDQNHFYNYYYSTEMSLFIFNTIMSLNNFYFNMNKSYLFSPNFTKLNNYEYVQISQKLTEPIAAVSKENKIVDTKKEPQKGQENQPQKGQENQPKKIQENQPKKGQENQESQKNQAQKSQENQEAQESQKNQAQKNQEKGVSGGKDDESEEEGKPVCYNLVYLLKTVEKDFEKLKPVINFYSRNNTLYFNNTIRNINLVINDDKKRRVTAKYQSCNIINNNNMYYASYNNPIININPDYNDLLTIYLTSLYNYNKHFRNINNLFSIYSNFSYNFHNIFLFMNKKNDIFCSLFKMRFKKYNSKELADLIISFDKLCSSNKTQTNYQNLKGKNNVLENNKNGTTYIYLNNQNTEKKIKNYEYAIHNCISEFFYMYDNIVYDINATGNISYYFKEDNAYLYFDHDKDIEQYQERENHFFKINAIERDKIDDIDKRVEKVMKYQKYNKLKNDSIDLNTNTKDSSNLYKNKNYNNSNNNNNVNNNKRKKNEKNENYYQESELEKDLMSIQFKKNDVIEKFFPYFFYLNPSMYNNNLSNISLNTIPQSTNIQKSSNSIDSPSNINHINLGDTSNNNYVSNNNEENDNENNVKYNNYINNIDSNIVGKYDKID